MKEACCGFAGGAFSATKRDQQRTHEVGRRTRLIKETSVCILDDAGKILKEVKVASEPQALLKVLGNPGYRFKRIGLEAGPLSQWLKILKEVKVASEPQASGKMSLTGRWMR